MRALTRQVVTLAGAETFRVGTYGTRQELDLALHGVDSIVHLAGLAHVPPWGRVWTGDAWNRLQSESHVRPAEAVAQAAIRKGVRRMVYISSLAAVASSSAAPVDPLSPPQPAGAYGRAKLLAEQRLREICHGSGLELVMVRPPMIYGRGGPGNASRLAAWIRRGRPVPVPAQPNSRSLLFVGNFLSLLQKILETPQPPDWPVLVQDDRPVSTEELARLVGEAVGKPARIWKIPGATLRGWAKLAPRALTEKLWGNLAVDSSRTEKFFLWTPAVKVEEGIRLSFGGCP